MSPKKEKALYDELAKAVRGMSSERLTQILEKTEAVNIRVTAAEKAGMKRTASRYGLTLTEYLTRLHALAEEITERKKGSS